MRAILAWGFYANRRKPAYGSVGRPPRINPAITEIANSTIATKNTILAASIATPAIMPKPSNAAISAIIRKVTAHQHETLLTSIAARSRVLGNVICSDLVHFCDQADTLLVSNLGRTFPSRESGDQQ